MIRVENARDIRDKDFLGTSYYKRASPVALYGASRLSVVLVSPVLNSTEKLSNPAITIFFGIISMTCLVHHPGNCYLQFMDRFSISDIENLCDIKAHTLRIWEKRHNILLPKRKESNHRYYDNDDLKCILQVAYLYHHGYKISKIARLKKEEIKDLTLSIKTGSEQHLFFVNALLEAAFKFNDIAFEQTLNTAIERLGFEDCIIKVVYPYFEKVGLLWMNDVAVPAQEHFSSNIIRHKIIVAIDKMQPASADSEVTLLFTPEAEYHEIPLLFANYLFKKQNKQVIYLGANLPLNTLKIFIEEKKIKQLFFHLITNFTKFNIDEYLSKLSKTFPSQKIIMSGPLTHHVNIYPSNCYLLRSLEELIQFIKN